LDITDLRVPELRKTSARTTWKVHSRMFMTASAPVTRQLPPL
jgi:hypothetical protein